MRRVLLALAVVGAMSTPSVAATQTTRQFMDAHCKSLTPGCTDPIAQALNDAAKAGRIPPKCVAGRPPMPPMTLDIALWLSGHHDMDAKPLSESAVVTAERLWPCSKVQ